MITKEEIVTAIKELDEHMDDTSDAFRPACVLLSSFYMPADEEEIATMLDYPTSEVIEYGKHLRNHGVWRGKELFAEWLNTKDSASGVAFWLDTMVAQGLLERASSDHPGKYRYKHTAKGEAAAIQLIQQIARKDDG